MRPRPARRYFLAAFRVITLLWLRRRLEVPANSSLYSVLTAGATVKVTAPSAPVVPVATTAHRGFLPVRLSRLIVAPTTPL